MKFRNNQYKGQFSRLETRWKGRVGGGGGDCLLGRKKDTDNEISKRVNWTKSVQKASEY